MPGRNCGECTACCSDLLIDTPELQKQNAVLCTHCTKSGGCSIYDDRPEVCRNWYCLWRQLPNLDDAWRPDRIGLMGHTYGASDGYSQTIKWNVIGPPGMLKSKRVLSVFATFVQMGVGVYISAGAPAGYAGGKTLINGLLSPSVRSGDFKAAKEAIWKAYRLAKAVPRVPNKLQYRAD